ncbi:hypothetical protein [Streptomyces sp. NPDC101206]|uniref:hypothetical protein n=1 Tax=Streptomyces sp. NPDC101206 TaxID=3366128 RepID=UPI0038035D8E
MRPSSALAALLHAATTTELRLLTLDDLIPARHAVRFPGRTADLTLDTATWKALTGCLGHRASLGTDNPHVLVTRLTRTTKEPVGAAHIRDSLAPVDLLPRILRSTRLLTLAAELDIKQLTAALGMSYNGAAHYIFGLPAEGEEFVDGSADVVILGEAAPGAAAA